MSYNPTLFQNAQKAKESQGFAGVSHSAITKRQGAGFGSPANKVKADYGYCAEVATIGNARVKYLLLFSNNNLGYGVSKGDIHYRVWTGLVYVTIKNEDGTRDLKKLQAGQDFTAKAGTEFSIATGSGDAELYVTESKTFHKTWKSIEPPIIGTEETPLALEQATRTRTDVQKTIEQAREMRASRIQHVEQAERLAAMAPLNPNSASSMGVNLRPEIPTDDD